MTIEFVGSSTAPSAAGPISVTGLNGGTTDAADGDWVFWFIYYPNVETVAFADPTGWTRLRKTIGTLGTVELWMRRWMTGDPTSWTINTTGNFTADPANPGAFLQDQGALVVFRDLTSDPTIMSATEETTSFPITIDAITDAGISNGDLALLCVATNYNAANGVTSPTLDGGINISGGSVPGLLVGFRSPTTGFSPSITVSESYFGPPNTTQVFGLQVILPGTPLGGWAVGMVRMGSN